jgi:hypothetical protein
MTGSVIQIWDLKYQCSWSQRELRRGGNIWICIWKDKTLLISHFEACSCLPTKTWIVELLLDRVPFKPQWGRNFKIILDGIKNNQFYIINSLWNCSLLFWIILSLISRWFPKTYQKMTFLIPFPQTLNFYKCKVQTRVSFFKLNKCHID